MARLTFREREQRLARLEIQHWAQLSPAERGWIKLERGDLLATFSDAELDGMLGDDAPFFASLTEAELDQMADGDEASYHTLRAADEIQQGAATNDHLS